MRKKWEGGPMTFQGGRVKGRGKKGEGRLITLQGGRVKGRGKGEEGRRRDKTNYSPKIWL